MKSDRHIPILMKLSVKLTSPAMTAEKQVKNVRSELRCKRKAPKGRKQSVKCCRHCVAVSLGSFFWGLRQRLDALATAWLCLLICSLFWGGAISDATAQSTVEASTASTAAATQDKSPEIAAKQLTSDPAAKELLERVIKHLVGGPAFDAMVRETVHVSQHDVVGVGTYEQAGGGTGCYHLQLSMHDGHGKHSLRQISDGRLAWTRNEIAGNVSLRRVDVARLDEWIQTDSRALGLPPRLLVGGWAELLLTLNNDYHLRLGSSNLSGQRVLVVTGNLKPAVRQTVLSESGRGTWPELYPTEIRVAIATQPDPKTGFGKWLPVRMEFRGDPILVPDQDGYTTSKNGPLITLIEIYSLRSIDPPPPERFRFENQNAEVDIINETDRYMRDYGVRLTESERRSLRR